MGKQPTIALLWVLLAAGVTGQARLQDLVDVAGVRDNQIRGVGLVVGLNGTGDGTALVRQMAANVFRRLGLQAPPSSIAAANMAVVMVTAELPPFSKPGSRIDVHVSSMGDAKSLRGGALLATQLVGFDNQTVYAIAEGPLATGGVSAQGNSGSKETLNHPTAGRIPGGGIVEKEVPQRFFGSDGRLRLMLRERSYKTAVNLAEAINGKFPSTARTMDGLTVAVTLPAELRQDPVGFLARIGDLRVAIAARARIVINERNGTIIAGGDVVLLPVTISYSNLSISTKEAFDVSQPPPLSEGETVVTPRSEVAIEERGTEMRSLPGTVNAGELASTLNSLGVSPQDLVNIFQMLKAQGALQAELRIQ